MSAFKTNKYLKADARESLIGNLTTTVLSIFLYTLSTMLLSERIASFSPDSVLLTLLLSLFVFFIVNTCANMLRIGLSCIFLKLQFGERASVGDLLYAFRNNSDAAVIISAFIASQEVLCILPYLLFVTLAPVQSGSALAVAAPILLVAGTLGTIAVRIRYAVCTYLFLDFPGYTAGELLRGNARLMKGHLGRLFSLYFSFIPLYFLSLMSLGVAGLWVSSYSHAAEAAFYKDLMNNTSF